jgi:hypothetical protein
MRSGKSVNTHCNHDQDVENQGEQCPLDGAATRMEHSRSTKDDALQPIVFATTTTSNGERVKWLAVDKLSKEDYLQRSVRVRLDER